MCFRRRLRTQPRYGAEYHKYEIKQLLDNRNFIQEPMKIVLQKLLQAVKKAFSQLQWKYQKCKQRFLPWIKMPVNSKITDSAVRFK